MTQKKYASASSASVLPRGTSFGTTFKVGDPLRLYTATTHVHLLAIDTNMRIELEVGLLYAITLISRLMREQTRLAHIQPSEILLPKHGLTPQTAKMLTEFSG
jgi:hypothetical protein